MTTEPSSDPNYIIIDVENGMTGATAELELPVSAPMHDLLPAIAQQLQMQPNGLQLRNKNQGFTYAEMDTLASRNTRHKDFCQLSAVAEAGAEVGR